MHEELAVSIRQSRALIYVTDAFNVLDWLHFVFLILTMGYWGYFWQLTSQFQIPPSFQILHDVTTDVRPFLVNAEEEFSFLQFVDRLHDVSDALATYSTYAGVCVLLFISRILKALDFQERMGLVTKTIEVCVCVCVCTYVEV